MAVGDIITAQRYNNMLQKVRNVLGKGGGTTPGANYGYGQVLTSVDKTAVTDSIKAKDMVDLLTDINKCILHQTGSISSELVNVIAGDIIADDVSDDTVLNSGDGDKKGYVDFENVVNALVTNRANAAGNGLETIDAQSTETNWRGKVVHTAVITFDGGYSTTNVDGTAGTASAEDHYRHFFNTGGSIVFTASVSADTSPAASTSKNANWNGMLSACGQIKLNLAGVNGSSGTGSTTSALDIPIDNNYVKYFSKTGSGNYDENEYFIEIRRPSAGRLDFSISLVDYDTSASDIDTPGYAPTDEFVTGTTASTIAMYRADDTNSVNVVAPTKGTGGNAPTFTVSNSI